ncbi:NAD-dependent epimerase/dehydratase family protein [Myxococcota bacterium]|nr:NAD-dependent epimerase/dehydratase family protein [Myxococcota bacterium]
MSAKSVLVTGATTPLGRAIVSAFLEDHEIRHVLAVAAEPTYPRPERGTEKLTYHRVDLTKERELRDLMFGAARELGIDTIVHAALHRSARDGGRRVHALNVESTRELLRLAERHPTVERFVFRSCADVYKLRTEFPTVIAEDHPLELAPEAPQWIRDRVEADLTVCTQMGVSRVAITVLRFAECLVPESGSQLYDYLTSRVCLTPLGFDPLINLISVEDLVLATRLAALSGTDGVFNIPGRDTLPLSDIVARWSRQPIPVPGLLLGPLYRMRSRLRRTDFRYDLNYWRFHLSAVLDGTRAREVLGYEPEWPMAWPAG